MTSSSEIAAGSGRFRRIVHQFLMFGIVGGSGTIVNLVVGVLAKKIAGWTAGISEYDVFVNLFGTEYNIRWYTVFLTIAFVVANTWNYHLNRRWIFRDHRHRSWWSGFLPFLFTGIGAFVVSQAIMPLLMNPNSPVGLSSEVFDDSTGFRTKFYWASAISIAIAMPVNFVINRFWVFRRPACEAVSHESAPGRGRRRPSS